MIYVNCDFKGVTWEQYLDMLIDNRHLVKNARNMMNIDAPCKNNYHSIACLKENGRFIVKNNILHLLGDVLKNYQITSDYDRSGGQYSTVKIEFMILMEEFQFKY